MASLSLTDLTWTPPGHDHCNHQFQLRDASLQVGAGEFVGLIGPNGSGKTSLLRCAYRFTKPEHGDVLLEHQDVWKHSAKCGHNASPWCCRNFPTPSVCAWMKWSPWAARLIKACSMATRFTTDN